MINIFKIALSGIRKAIESAQGLAIEADSLPSARRSKSPELVPALAQHRESVRVRRVTLACRGE